MLLLSTTKMAAVTSRAKQQIPTPETKSGMGTSPWRKGFCHRLSGQALLMIGL